MIRLTFDELATVVPPLKLGWSDWVTIDQQMIDTFAEVTGDYQWIHTDPVRAAEGPFGSTVAHGYLTLSIVSQFLSQSLAVSGASMAVNYGVNRVRFPKPVAVNSQLRAELEVIGVLSRESGMELTMRATCWIKGDAEKPACVAEPLILIIP